MPKQRKSTRPNDRTRQSATGAEKGLAKRAKPGQEPAQRTTPARPSKKASILGLLQRPHGAAIGELTKATGWQTHSVRAVLTGFRKEGKELIRAKDEAGLTRYRIPPEA